LITPISRAAILKGLNPSLNAESPQALDINLVHVLDYLGNSVNQFLSKKFKSRVLTCYESFQHPGSS
jgi:flagellin-specific chaperone FliS